MNKISKNYNRMTTSELMGRSVWRKKSFFLHTIISGIILFISSCAFMGENDNRDVDLSTAVKLTAEKVGLITDPRPSATSSIFKFAPGTPVNASSLGGAIDPTGTSILNDFDGDGILNIHETNTNVWVSDYPIVETTIAPPVTMKIEILLSSELKSDEIISEINSQDFESTRNQGSESIHQNEVNLKTVQYEDTYGSSLTVGIGGGSGVDAGAALGGSETQDKGKTTKTEGSGVNYSNNSSKSWGATFSTNQTVTKWADKPFKNNLDREGWSVKANSSTDKARKFRREKAQKINESSKVDSNAGYVRAALYIENLSVNMPVKLKNILCSLMFESSSGDLIPIQSFRLRNADYSLFEVAVYGGTKFGPYVIELDGLNTAEIQRAITSGYTPKIYIVDYEMTHVPDSNYRSVLMNFGGENLKIVEENSKARTALIKIYGPGFREMYRVAAFDVDGGGNENPCTTKSVNTNLSPGISLRRALKRIACSGIEIKFRDTIVDFEEIAPKIDKSRIFTSSIFSIAGVESTIPCLNKTNIVGSDGAVRSGCEQTSLNTWDQTTKENAGFWVIFSKGKYYNFTEYVMHGSEPNRQIALFDPSASKPAQVLKGIDSTIWAGDTIDIVYISMKDYGAKIKDFGTSPLVTNLPFQMNTKWDSIELGDTPYYPTKKSAYLGAVGFGEKVEVKIKLDKTRYLNPTFGTPEIGGSFQYFTDFSYDMKRSVTNDLYEMEEVSDFEVSLGFGGQRTDWMHIEKDISTSDPYKLQSCGVNFVLVTQTLTLCLQLPTQHTYLNTETSIVELYLRPSYNNAYRNSVWPLHYSQVAKMRGKLAADFEVGATIVKVSKPTGLIEVGDTLFVGDAVGPFTVILPPSDPDSEGVVTITLNQANLTKVEKTELVTTKSNLKVADVKLTQDVNFLTQWNTDAASNFVPTAYTQKQIGPFLTNSSINCAGYSKNAVGCLGFRPDFNAVNWMGNYNQGVAAWSSWADGGDFSNFLANGLFSLTNSAGQIYQLQPGASDFEVSQHTSTSTFTGPQVVSFGDTALVVWKKDSDLWGRFYQISTQQPAGAMVDLNVTAVSGKFIVKVNETGKAVLLWQNGNDLYVTCWDMTSKARAWGATDLKVVTRDPWAVGNGNFDLAVGTSQAMLIWTNAVINPFNVDTFAAVRTYQLTNGTADAISNVAHAVKDGGLGGYKVSASGEGNTAFLTFSHMAPNGSGGYRYIATGVVYTLSTAARVGGNIALVDLSYTSSSGLTSIIPSASMSGNYGLILYKLPDASLKGRGVDLVNATVLGTAFTVDTGVSAYSDVATSPAFGALAYTTTTSEARLKIVHFPTGQLLFAKYLTLNSPLPANTRAVAKPVIVNEKVLTVWSHEEGSGKTIRGRLASVVVSPTASFSLQGSGEFFVSTSNKGAQQNPTVTSGSSLGKALTFWQAPAETPYPMIHGFTVNLLNPGALQYGLNNFFVAPLIERDYTITSKIKY